MRFTRIMNMATSRRNESSLTQKVNVIEYARKNSLQSSWKIVDSFKFGHMQIQEIIKKKKEILSQYQASSMPASRKQCRVTSLNNIDDAMYRWYSLARSCNVPIIGLMLQEEARLIAVEMEHHNFKVSNGWLESFKNATTSGNLLSVEKCGVF